jgi:hypothetical protein
MELAMSLAPWEKDTAQADSTCRWVYAREVGVEGWDRTRTAAVGKAVCSHSQILVHIRL